MPLSSVNERKVSDVGSVGEEKKKNTEINRETMQEFLLMVCLIFLDGEYVIDIWCYSILSKYKK